MQTSIQNVKYLVGDHDVLTNIADVKVLPMFSEEMTEFLYALSRELMHDKRAKQYVDVLSYAYWIRKSSLEKQKQKYPNAKYRLGRGVSFHIAPSNVPVNFAVSMTSAILAGNACVIRVSNKEFDQVTIITDAMNKLLEAEFANLKSYFCIIRYEHSKEITDYLSSICDLRIIWGGDNTINNIRQSPLPERAIEMTFADRYSIAIIDSDKYLEADSQVVANGFFTDTYYTDQNACSSPRLVVWLGERKQEAKERFWSELSTKVRKEYDMKPIQAVNKYQSFCELAMAQELVGIDIELESDDNYIVRVQVDKLTPELMDFKNGGGYFFEYDMNSIEELVPILGKRCQTLSVLGIDKKTLLSLAIENGVRGVDRIVDLGETMGLEFVWDGFIMIETMTRIIYINE